MSVDQVIFNVNVGGSSSDDAVRQVGWSIPQEGWEQFVDRMLEPTVAAGCKRIALHNPYGKISDERMQIDQNLAMATTIPEYDGDFRAAMSRFKTRHPGVEVIAYIGSTYLDENFENIEPEAWMARWASCLRPYLDLDMSVCFDAAVGMGDPDDDPAHRDDVNAILSLEGLGVTVYVETFPALDKLWTRRMRAMGREKLYLDMHHAPLHPSHENKYLIRHDVDGNRTAEADNQCEEYVRFTWMEPPEDVDAANKRIIDQGDTAMVRLAPDELAALVEYAAGK